MKEQAAANQSIDRKHLRVGLICLAMTFGMLGMSFAAVPLYQLFCQITGYGGTTQRAEYTPGTVLSKGITIRFDANVSNNLNWDFEPLTRSVTLKVGDKGQVSYRAQNLGRTSFGTATFNVSPPQAGAYFNKIECFCFTEQKLAHGEKIDMPVIFFVDPEIAEDPLLKDLETITLSYTFFPDEDAEAAARQASLKREKTKDGLLDSAKSL